MSPASGGLGTRVGTDVGFAVVSWWAGALGRGELKKKGPVDMELASWAVHVAPQSCRIAR